MADGGKLTKTRFYPELSSVLWLWTESKLSSEPLLEYRSPPVKVVIILKVLLVLFNCFMFFNQQVLVWKESWCLYGLHLPRPNDSGSAGKNTAGLP